MVSEKASAEYVLRSQKAAWLKALRDDQSTDRPSGYGTEHRFTSSSVIPTGARTELKAARGVAFVRSSDLMAEALKSRPSIAVGTK